MPPSTLEGRGAYADASLPSLAVVGARGHISVGVSKTRVGAPPQRCVRRGVAAVAGHRRRPRPHFGCFFRAHGWARSQRATDIPAPSDSFRAWEGSPSTGTEGVRTPRRGRRGVDVARGRVSVGVFACAGVGAFRNAVGTGFLTLSDAFRAEERPPSTGRVGARMPRRRRRRWAPTFSRLRFGPFFWRTGAGAFGRL